MRLNEEQEEEEINSELTECQTDKETEWKMYKRKTNRVINDYCKLDTPGDPNHNNYCH